MKTQLMTPIAMAVIVAGCAKLSNPSTSSTTSFEREPIDELTRQQISQLENVPMNVPVIQDLSYRILNENLPAFKERLAAFAQQSETAVGANKAEVQTMVAQPNRDDNVVVLGISQKWDDRQALKNWWLGGSLRAFHSQQVNDGYVDDRGKTRSVNVVLYQAKPDAPAKERFSTQIEVSKTMMNLLPKPEMTASGRRFRQTVDHFYKALIEKNLSELKSAPLSEDFTFVNPVGTTNTREEAISQLARNFHIQKNLLPQSLTIDEGDLKSTAVITVTFSKGSRNVIVALREVITAEIDASGELTLTSLTLQPLANIDEFGAFLSRLSPPEMR